MRAGVCGPAGWGEGERGAWLAGSRGEGGHGSPPREGSCRGWQGGGYIWRRGVAAWRRGRGGRKRRARGSPVISGSQAPAPP